MNEKLMLLPGHNPADTLLVQIPEDYEEHEAYRHVTGVIAKVEQSGEDSSRDEIMEILSDHGFISVNFILGPAINPVA